MTSLRARTHRTRNGRRLLAAVAVPLTALSLLTAPAAPAVAAGSGVLTVKITPVDFTNPDLSNPQTTAGVGQHSNRVTYQVDYACAVADCTGTTVRLSAPQPNPYGIAVASGYLGPWSTKLLTYNTWTAPTAGGTISGDDTTGKLVTLGTVPAGSSGQFRVSYAFPPSINRTAVPTQLYPNGFQIVHTATIDSPSAMAPVAATAAPVTWNIGTPNGPAIVMAGPGSIKPGVNVNYQIRMNSGSMGLGGGNIYGMSTLVAAGNYAVTLQLAPQAVFVSADYGGVYDPVNHTVTWTEGTEAVPTFCAGGGWGSTAANSNTWNVTPPCYAPHNVVVNYPAANFPEATNGCNFDVNVSPSVKVDVTYLDTARTRRSATTSNTHAVSCYEPFGRLNVGKDSNADDTSTAVRQVYVPPVVTGMMCDSSGYDDWGRPCTPGQPLAPFPANTRYWLNSAYNAGNVPGIATITDDDLDQPGMPVTRIDASPAATIAYTYQCGTSTPVSGSYSGTVLLLSALVGSATDCRFTTATATSNTAIAPGNIRPSDTGIGNLFRVNYYYTVVAGTAPGVRTNTMSATMTYPGYPEITDTFTKTTSRQVNLRGYPMANVKPAIAAGFPVAPVVDGGGLAVPGREVTFSINGSTSRFGGVNDFAPQYIFIAPVDWTIKNGSAAFAPGAVPAGVTFTYRTVTISGAPRQVVIASWPPDVTFGKNVTLPTMTVVATPTYAVPSGTTSQAAAWIGDSRNVWTPSNATFTAGGADVADVDGDGSTTEGFATATQGVFVSGISAASVLKEICRPDATAADGCEWLSDPTRPVPVSTSESSIKYRVTIQNTGNANLTGVVAYDVLPYVGDTGVSDLTATTPRGSSFDETLVSTQNVGAGLTLSYSSSTNPPRSEVYSGSTTGSWGATAAGARAIRAAYSGTLTPGQKVSFGYTAGVTTGSSADAIACNSIAIRTAQTVTSEPPAVCALTAEADLEITVPDRLPLQAGRPGSIPFLVTNHGGSAHAPAVVTVDIPSGVTVASLAPQGWSCTASGASAPVAGPRTLSCQPVDALGAVKTIDLGTPLRLDLPVVVDAAAASLCVPAEVTSRMVDPQLANNETQGCVAVAPFTAGLRVQKDDARTVVGVGDQYSYVIEVDSLLVGESLTGVVLRDELPAGLVFVSASGGGTLSGAAADGSGGVVTWPAVDLAPTGTASAGGSATAGGTGTGFARTVTVRVLPSAIGQVENLARATAPDPAGGATPLQAVGTDVDGLRKLVVTKASDAPAAGVRSGQFVEYTVTIVNAGTVAYTSGSPATVVDDLTRVLDDASFVAGSATVTIGASSTALADPVSGLLTWSGALAVGGQAVLSYRVKVGDGTTGDRRLVNTAYASGSVSSCTDGLDPQGASCATTSSAFAPVIDKRVASITQGDDGRWTIVYAIDVTNLDDDAAASYRLDDALAFGSGIAVASAAVTSAPSGVTPGAWSGSGTIANAQVPAGGTHSYQVTVIADAAGTAGTAAAACATGVAGGFANVATLTPAGGAPVKAEACASPVAPTVTKTVAPPVQQPDGSWIVSYTITVTNRSTAPAGGLAYTLDDHLTLPSGVQVLGVTAAGPAGAPVSAGFDGTSSRALLTGVDRIPAAGSSSSPSTRVYIVTLHAQVPAGAGTAASFACAPAGTGGYANAVTLFAGTSTTQLGSASACAPVTPLPTPTITKRVVSTSIDAGSGEWTIRYRIVVTNPSAEFSTVYDLDDELQFAAGAAVQSSTATSTEAPVLSTWDGTADPALVRGRMLAPAAVDTFEVTAVVDLGAVDTDSAAADCRIDPGETGTGLRNLATVRSGTTSAVAAACEPATDPSVVKAVSSAPQQDPATGVWTMSYEIVVTNRSTTSVAGGIPYAVSDQLELPTGVEVLTVAASSVGGAVNPAFDGVTATDLGTGAIAAAVDDATPTRHRYTVTVTFRVPGGLTADVQCSPTDTAGGLLNVAEIIVGSRKTGATACADVPDVPMPGIAKTVISQTQQADGTWAVVYGIQVGNPSATAAVRYDLADDLALGAGMSLVGQPTVTAPSGAPVDPAWNGSGTLVENMLLPGGATHSYTVRAVVDTGSLRGTDAAADCTLDAGETGTGFLNRASLTTGVADADAEACATLYDPSVAKTVDGVPVLQADGSWLVSYTVSVANPSAVALRYGLVDALDFPAGSAVSVVSSAARSGGPAVLSDWNGRGRTQLVAEGTELPASAVHIFDVTLRVRLAAGQTSVAEGFANTATVSSGVDGVVTSDARAAADLLVPELEVEKSVVTDAVPRIGSTASYEIVIRNVGQGDFTALYPAVVWDDLSGVLDDATVTGAPVANPAVGAVTASGERISWRGALLSGATVTLSYEVTIGDGGDGVLDNIAFAAEPLAVDPAAPAVGDCAAAADCSATSTGLPAVQVEKSASTSRVVPGDVVVYTVRVTNTGTVDIPAGDPVAVEDDLSGVLTAADYRGDAHADRGDVVDTGGRIAWSGGLTAGEVATITYSVTVRSGAPVGTRLTNVVTTDPTLLSLTATGTPASRTATTVSVVQLLASTGAEGLLLASGAALVVMGLGGLLLVVVRRRRRA